MQILQAPALRLYSVQVNPEKRLGSGPSGVEEIKSHSWFSSLDWGAIQQRSAKAPLQPEPEFEVGELEFAPFQPEPLKASQVRKDVFAEEWEQLWEWVGERA